jgi:DNA-binding LacI/PurR family transcriptional regulator
VNIQSVKRVTMRDLAELLGRSVATISRALNNEPGLTKENRDAILKAARELGYDFATLRTGRIRRILFLLHTRNNTERTSGFYSAVMHGAEAACRERKLILSFMAVDPADNIAERLRGQSFDAMICAGYFEFELLAALRNTGKPLVLIDSKVHGYSSVNPDNMTGAYLATQHLLRSGRSRIAMISASAAQYSIRERIRGFRTALYDANVLLDPRYEVTVTDGMGLEDGVHTATQTLLALPRRPDAILCYNDAAALIAVRTCAAAGLRIPQDIAIAGFDDIADAMLGHRPLTTIHVDQHALGEAGVELLLSPAPRQPVERTVPIELVVRASTLQPITAARH